MTVEGIDAVVIDEKQRAEHLSQLEKAEAMLSRLIDMRVPHPQTWAIMKQANGVVISKFVGEECVHNCIMSEMIWVGITPEMVVRALQSDFLDKITAEDPMVLSVRFICDPVPDEPVYLYVEVKAPWPISNRDFVSIDRIRHDQSTGRYFASGTSVVIPGVPEQAGLVRGSIIGKQMTWWATDDRTGCHVQEVSQIDPKGMIPSVIATQVAIQQGFNILRLGQHLRDLSNLED